MSTALDSNILVALWDADDALHHAARQLLEKASANGRLVISGLVYAELLAAPGRSEAFLDQFCEDTRIGVEWELKERVWREAGIAYQRYGERRKRQGANGPRRILADFLIGAHAMVNGYRLLTLDGRLYRASFPKLAIETI
ncbi:MAG: type II toxin-antitoxin system VapC family toxin [Acidobacteria bacterium]|nr:type II toxin-antitoxin system VapC family toxin [Acidobacteriota bacterium]MBS1866600.1 type II toxin-antitoxin system VapC family toxin [Acidobacteriota bacterium]